VTGRGPVLGTRRSGSPSARRRLSPSARRSELLEAAIRVLRRLGPDASRVEDITREAGTAKGNFYRYFPTWGDLLLAVRDSLLDSYQAALIERYRGPGPIDWWAALEAEIERFVDFQVELGGLHEVLFHDRASSGRPVEANRSARSTVALFLAAGIADGAFAPVDADVVAPLLFDVLHGAADTVQAGVDRDRVLAAVRLIVERTLDPAGAESMPPHEARSGD